MPDNWTYVAAAYALAALVFGAYWLRLNRRERELVALTAGRTPSPSRPVDPRNAASSRPPSQP